MENMYVIIRKIDGRTSLLYFKALKRILKQLVIFNLKITLLKQTHLAFLNHPLVSKYCNNIFSALMLSNSPRDLSRNLFDWQTLTKRTFGCNLWRVLTLELESLR